MPKQSDVGVDIANTLAAHNHSMTVSEIMMATGHRYTQRQVLDSLKYMVWEGRILVDASVLTRCHRFLLPKRLSPTSLTMFDESTVSMAKKLDLDLSGPVGWFLEISAICRDGQMARARAAGTARASSHTS